MADKLVADPTYMRDIRHFFRDGDKTCMDGMGIDLSTYDGVKFNALRIYFKVRDGEMPLGGPPWSKERVETFYNWMKNDYPRGLAAPSRPKPVDKTDDQFQRPESKREDAARFSGTRLDKLKTAFEGLMNKPIDDPDSYYAVAGIHWLPKPGIYCRHHENAYNPWHRAYLIRLEDALRKIPGCEDVSIPYWDITAGSIPSFLFEPPFDTYTFPTDLFNLTGRRIVKKGDKTRRRNANQILDQLKTRDVAGLIEKAQGHSRWELFNGWDKRNTQEGIISAHDNGHLACGPTMANQDVAAFDPIFWFFHCNWDRLWWEWQLAYDATTVDKFKSHLQGPADWLMDPVLNALPPFSLNSGDTINLANFNVDYGKPKARKKAIKQQALMVGSLAAVRKFEVRTPKKVSLRAKNIDRLKIPGSFDVVLQVRDEEIARTGFFQSTTPRQCAACSKKALANFDFVVDLATLNGPVSLKVVLHQNGREIDFPLTACGAPSVNARLLLS